MKRICMSGYDDVTRISEEDWGAPFTDGEIEVIKKIEELSGKISTSGAEPVLWLEDEGDAE